MTTDKTPTFALKLPDFYAIAITDYIVGLVIRKYMFFIFVVFSPRFMALVSSETDHLLSKCHNTLFMHFCRWLNVK